MKHRATLRYIGTVSSFLASAEVPDYVRQIWLAFLERNGKDGHYSMRAFARDLGLDAGHLTRVLSGQRVLRPSTAHRLKERLAMNDEVGSEFVRSAYRADKRRSAA